MTRGPRCVFRAIVSGGQTGVDRAALDVAKRLGIPTDGWCPRGRLAEDGSIPLGYRLRETISSRPAERTGWNVFDSDATLVMTPGPPSGGTALTLKIAHRFDRPSLVVELRPANVGEVVAWLDTLPRPLTLNVAGPRESGAPGIYATATRFITDVLENVDIATAPPRVALVTGGHGLLGSELVRLAPPAWDVHWTARRHAAADPRCHPVELSDHAAVSALSEDLRPDLIIHTAYSQHRGERDIWLATRNVTRAAENIGAGLIYVSSDMVLDGGSAPYDESAPAAPINEYGGWKARAEELVLTSSPHNAAVRVSLLTRFEPPDPRSEWVVDSLRAASPITVFTDELRSPILVDDLARQIWEIARLAPIERGGTWNLAGPESLSRFSLALLVAAASGIDPTGLQALETPSSMGPRPRDLRLTTARADRQLLTRARPLSVAAAEAKNLLDH